MEWDAGAIMRIAIGVFFILFGVGLAFALFRLGEVFKRLSGVLSTTDSQIVPLLTRVEGTLDGVNSELDKVDQLTGSVVGIVRTAEQATSAVQSAVSKPVQKVSGLAAGLNAGISSFMSRRKKEQ